MPEAEPASRGAGGGCFMAGAGSSAWIHPLHGRQQTGNIRSTLLDRSLASDTPNSPVANPRLQPAKWRVVKPAVLRIDAALDSPTVGQLNQTDVIFQLEARQVDGVTRIRCGRGWTSTIARSGNVLLERVADPRNQPPPLAQLRRAPPPLAHLGAQHGLGAPTRPVPPPRPPLGGAVPQGAVVEPRRTDQASSASSPDGDLREEWRVQKSAGGRATPHWQPPRADMEVENPVFAAQKRGLVTTGRFADV